MKFSIVRIQKFFTLFLSLHILVLLYQTYLQQNTVFAWIVGFLSCFVFLSFYLISRNQIEISIWISTVSLVLISFCMLAILNGNEVYLLYHLILPGVLLFYFRKGPVYLFGITSCIFFILGYFYNENIAIYPEKYSLNNVYFLCLIVLGISQIIVSVMTPLYAYVVTGEEMVIEEKSISQYLEPDEISYIFYLKAVADNITATATEVRNTALKNIENIMKEKGRLATVVEVANIMQKTFYNTMESINLTRDIIHKTLNAAMTGEQKVIEIMSMVNKMMKFVDITKKSIYELSSATKKVEGVVSVIDKIASQTRLLSLNASIEGARFEGQQAGFIMVSKEVKQLAALTHLSVQDITNTMRDINNKTRGVQEIISKEGKEALEGLEVARLGEQSIKYVVRMMESIQSEINEISDEMEINKNLAAGITDNFKIIKSFIEENYGHMEELSMISNDMKVQGDHLGKIIKSKQISEMLARQNDKIYSLLTRFVMDFDQIVAGEVRRGMISEEILFTRQYTKVSGEGEERFRCKYDVFFETHLQELIDNYKSLLPEFKYFIVMDNEGYIPLANISRETGVKEEVSEIAPGEQVPETKDKAILNKAGAILQDYISKQAIKSESIYSLQCIQTDGEPLMDMSVHLHYKEKFWGVVRAGFRYS